MSLSKQKKLSPKLRRLLLASEEDDKNRLFHDVTRREISASVPFAMAEEVQPQELSKRVLVALTSTQIPNGFKHLKWIHLVDQFYSVVAPLTELEALGQAREVCYVEAGRQFGKAISSSLHETHTAPVHTMGGAKSYDGTGVVIGIIDLGFDFTLDDFRNDDGTTRVSYLWDQGLTPQGAENSPAGFGYGVEYDKAAIDQALQQPDPFSVVRHKPRAGSHGTHVAGIAASNGRSADANFPVGQYVGMAPGATLIFVQPDASDQNTSFTDSSNVAEAIAYVYQRADQMGLPCVINMSLGQNGGSHDGESIVERAIDRWLEVPGRAFVVAAGNEHVWRGHASGTLPTGGTHILRWEVGGQMPWPGFGILPKGAGDFTPNEMEIWYSSRDRFELSLKDPNGETVGPISPGETSAYTFQHGAKSFLSSERFTPLNGDAQIYIELQPPGPGQAIQGGTWEVHIKSIESQEGRFDAWIERDFRRNTNNFADQSFFLGTDFDEMMTLGTPATSRRSIAVANYNHQTQAPNNSSGRGTTRDGRPKPEIAAPGTMIVASGALGGRPDPNDPQNKPHPMRVPMSGTSMSAPHVAGIVALLLQKDRSLTPSQIKKILIASASPPPGIKPFDISWGYGRVRALEAIALVDA